MKFGAMQNGILKNDFFHCSAIFVFFWWNIWNTDNQLMKESRGKKF